jgi:DNA-damage-inducible protein J
MSEEELYAKLETSRRHAAEGKVRGADDVVSDMRTKYGL